MHFYRLGTARGACSLRLIFAGALLMDPSFFFAIFKRLQAATGGMLTTGGEHFDSDGSMDLAGGFSLRSSVNSPLLDPHGLFRSARAFRRYVRPRLSRKARLAPAHEQQQQSEREPVVGAAERIAQGRATADGYGECAHGRPAGMADDAAVVE